MLVKAGCDVDKTDQNGDTAMHAAAMNGHAELVVVMLKPGCDKDKASNKIVTPLHAAAYFGHAEVVEARLRAGCDTSSLTSICGHGW